MIRACALLAIGLMAASPAFARDCAGPVVACPHAQHGSVALILPDRPTRILVDPGAEPGVSIAADALADDLHAVGGGPSMRVADAGQGAAVIAGTLGHDRLIDRLAAAGKIDVAGLKGQWEGYVEQVVGHPMPGVDRALVIAGSDRRGTIYGLYDVSAKAGVSPWTWWADVPALRHPTLYLTPGRVADHPVVKYRGIFINDEDPAFGGWARMTRGGVDHAVYQRLFTLLLRSKANFLWPAMWGKSLWQDDPASAPLARQMGIILGTSHHEPMERANVEWKRQGGGAWDYAKNAAALRSFWRAGLERRGGSEDPVTIGMRGDGDEPMTQGTAIPLLERIVADQRRIIADVTGKPADRTPQVWALYKEVQDYYDKGMRVPDDVTLLFSDDNWGNIRRLPPPGERRAGGYGVYYHFDYVGDPRDYKWIDTNAIPRVWQQMEMASRYGADRLWIVNVGDLKPMEQATSFFLDLAWNPARMTLAAMQDYPARWAAQQFGPTRGQAIGALIARYGLLASRRKPELLDSDSYALAGGGWGRVLGEWDALDAAARREAEAIPADRHDAYDELVLHRIDALTNLHRLYHAVAENRAAAASGDALATARWATAARAYFAQDAALRRRYESLAGGKWPMMMAQTHIGYTGWQQPDVDVMPALATVAAPLPLAPAVAPPPVTMAADAGRAIAGGGIGWQRIGSFTAEGSAMLADRPEAPAIDRPGGGSPHLVYPITVPPSGALAVTVVAAPGLDVTGHGRQRLAISVDGQAPVIGDLLAGDDDKAWARSVIDNRRTVTIRVAAPPGRRSLKLWLMDPQVVFERIELAPVPATS